MLHMDGTNALVDDTCVPCANACLKPDDIRIQYPNSVGLCTTDGKSYVGCLSIASDIRPNFPANIRYSFKNDLASDLDISHAHIVIEECSGKPADSTWVPYDSTGIGKQCYFACDYGISLATAATYREALATYIASHRRDLTTFNVMNPQHAQVGRVSTIKTYKTYGGGIRAGLTRWSIDKDVSLSTPCLECQSAYHDNTFLFIPEVPATNGLCLTQTAAKSLSGACEAGFRYSNVDFDQKCALLARNKLYLSNAENIPAVGTGLAILTPASYYVLDERDTPVCRADDAWLTSFQAICTHNCLDERYQMAMDLLAAQSVVSVWRKRFTYIQSYLSATVWRDMEVSLCYFFWFCELMSEQVTSGGALNPVVTPFSLNPYAFVEVRVLFIFI